MIVLPSLKDLVTSKGWSIACLELGVRQQRGTISQHLEPQLWPTHVLVEILPYLMVGYAD